MENEKTKHLLSQVSGLLKSYDKIAKTTGENFNIFSVMGMERDEVKTHSRIIAELLNPKGSHSQGSIFLKYFFEEIDELKNIENFNFEKATVKVEVHIGSINEDYTVGGYIDIVINDGDKNIIVIENKIDAPDQKGQLIRYKNHYNDDINLKLIYLTKNGKKPSEESYCHLDKKININIEDIILVCYKNKIISWIDRCHKEAIQQPMLREMLKQYSNLLKKLTHQTMNNELATEIKTLIKNNFAEASEIKNNYDNAKKEVISEFWKKTKEAIEGALDESWKINIDEGVLVSSYIHMLFHKNNKEKAYMYCRYNENNGELSYGIILNKEISDKKIKGTEVLKKIEEGSKFKNGPQSVIWLRDEKLNFNNTDFLTKVSKNPVNNEFINPCQNNILEFIKNKQYLAIYENTLTYLESK